MRTSSGQNTFSDSMDDHEHVRARLVAGWVNSAGIAGKPSLNPYFVQAEIIERKAFLEVVNRAWTDPKSIKFSLYSQQFRQLLS